MLGAVHERQLSELPNLSGSEFTMVPRRCLGSWQPRFLDCPKSQDRELQIALAPPMPELTERWLQILFNDGSAPARRICAAMPASSFSGTCS